MTKPSVQIRLLGEDADRLKRQATASMRKPTDHVRWLLREEERRLEVQGDFASQGSDR